MHAGSYFASAGLTFGGAGGPPTGPAIMGANLRILSASTHLLNYTVNQEQLWLQISPRAERS